MHAVGSLSSVWFWFKMIPTHDFKDYVPKKCTQEVCVKEDWWKRLSWPSAIATKWVGVLSDGNAEWLP